MKNYLVALIVCSLHSSLSGQGNYLLKVDQLNARIKNGGDTTYIINFWATWCVPCVRELPNLVKFREEYKAEEVRVLLVSIDFKSKLKSALIPFLKKRKLSGDIFLLDELDQQQYIDRIDTSWSGSLPATLFIKRQSRKFLETELSYPELVAQYKSMQ